MSTINELVKESYEIAKNHGFWDEPYSDKYFVETAPGVVEKVKADNPLSVPTKLWLAAGELVEAGIIHHKTDLSIKENMNAFLEEIADVFIRLFDLVGYLGDRNPGLVDLETIIAAKMIKNSGRPYKHGKNY